jgi:hypothetical protein
MTQVTGAPELYLSAPVTPTTLGQYHLYYKYDDDVILYGTLEVGTSTISDFPIGTPVDIVLDDDVVGGSGLAMTAHLYDNTGTELIPTASAAYDASVDGYVIQDVTFSSEQEVYVVWHVSSVQTHMTSYYVTQPVNEEVVLITAGSSSGANGTPHAGARVTVSKADGTQIVQGITDVAGDLRLEIPPGDYIFTLSKDGFVYTTNNFTKEVFNSSVIPADPNLYAVSGDTNTQAMQLVTEVFEPTITPAPAPADMCTLYATLYHMDGTPVRHAAIHVALVHRPQLFSGTAVFDTQRVYKTDSNGYVEFSLVQGIRVDISIAPLSLRRRIDVPASAGPTNLMTLLSGADDPFDIITPNISIAPKRTI